MKKYLMMFAAVLCCAGLSIQDAQAQQFPEGVDITLELAKMRTPFVFNDFMIPKIEYDGSEIKAGLIHCDYIFNYSNPNWVGFEKPEDTNFTVSFTDPYDRTYSLSDSKKLASKFNNMEFVEELKDDLFYSLPIPRGGQYVVKTSVPCINYYKEDKLEIKDDPSVRFELDGKKEGSTQLTIDALYNTGYPYDASQFSGNEKAEIHLYELSHDKDGNAIETEVASAEKILRLNRTDEPLVATIDTLRLTYPNPKVGLYVLKLTSDWDIDQANRKDIFITVVGNGLPEGVSISYELKEFKTYYRFDDWMNPIIEYKGEDIKAGEIFANYEFTTKNSNDFAPAIPDNPRFYVVYADPYGRVKTLSSPYPITNQLVNSEISDDVKSNTQFALAVPRGGKYTVDAYAPCIDYNKNDSFEATDDPSVRLYISEMDENSNLWTIDALFNTGYPYDASQFSGNEKAEMHLYKLSKDGKGDVVETEVASVKKTLRLNRSDEPLVAAIDTLRLANLVLDEGNYVVKMTSDWDFDQANRDDRAFTVNGGRITDIRNLKADPATSREEWCDLQGRKFTRKPTAPGIYLRNGIKIVIK